MRYRSLLSFDTSRPLRPWLLSIAANLARNRWRAIGRYLSALQRLVQSEPSHSTNAEQQGVNNLQSQRLWAAVQHLDHVDQQVIYLRYFLEMSTEETSDAMRVAPGTVKSRLHRALSRLRSVIEHEYPDLKDALG
jgi:RNA polymerase sigma-70 factor (ECF subfamily)